MFSLCISILVFHRILYLYRPQIMATTEYGKKCYLVRVMNRRKIIDGWVILSISAIIILIALNIPFTTTKPYTTMESYKEREPYTTTETYLEKESYIENVSLNINTTIDWRITDHRINDEFDLTATIKNIDTIQGEFWVTFNVESTKGSYNFTTNRVFLMPGESNQTRQTFNGSFSSVTYRVNQPTKAVTKYRDVSKDRNITGYNEIEKFRQVVKLKKYRGSLLERILNRNELSKLEIEQDPKVGKTPDVDESG